jgi:hypothetical protein
MWKFEPFLLVVNVKSIYTDNACTSNLEMKYFKSMKVCRLTKINNVPITLFDGIESFLALCFQPSLLFLI